MVPECFWVGVPKNVPGGFSLSPRIRSFSLLSRLRFLEIPPPHLDLICLPSPPPPWSMPQKRNKRRISTDGHFPSKPPPRENPVKTPKNPLFRHFREFSVSGRGGVGGGPGSRFSGPFPDPGTLVPKWLPRFYDPILKIKKVNILSESLQDQAVEDILMTIFTCGASARVSSYQKHKHTEAYKEEKMIHR